MKSTVRIRTADTPVSRELRVISRERLVSADDQEETSSQNRSCLWELKGALSIRLRN